MFQLVRNCSIFVRPAIAAAVLVVASAALGQQKENDRVEFKPYTGDPVYLDEPEPQPNATLVGKVVDSTKYENGNPRFERQIAKYSDDRLVADGFYREFYPGGEKFAEGQFDNGRQDGEWTYWHENGQISRKATYRDGQPDGSWKVYRADGSLQAERGFANGKRDGKWVIYDKTGKQPMREESYATGMADGTWKVWFPSGELQTEMNFKAGKRHGPTTIWDDKGVKRAEVNYEDNLLEGTAQLVGADGTKVTQEYSQGKLVSEKKL